MNNTTKRYLVKFLLIVPFLIINSGYSCTLWSIAGNRVKKEGILIAKNRDWSLDGIQNLKLFTPHNRLKYFALNVDGGKTPGVKAGINEKGLTILSASASVLNITDRNEDGRTENIIAKLLEKHEKVDDVINDKSLLKGPIFLMLADVNNIAVIEIGKNGQLSYDKIESGVLTHTNHYLNSDFGTDLNSNGIPVSSNMRFERINSLLFENNNLITMDSIKKMSLDQNGGADNSIFRTGSSPKKAKTLATWITYYPKKQDPFIYIRFINQNLEFEEHTLNFKTLWQ